jgi:hypothetical protein
VAVPCRAYELTSVHVLAKVRIYQNELGKTGYGIHKGTGKVAGSRAGKDTCSRAVAGSKSSSVDKLEVQSTDTEETSVAFDACTDLLENAFEPASYLQMTLYQLPSHCYRRYENFLSVPTYLNSDAV